MSKVNYSKIAKEAYGESCEWIGCGWNESDCDVHHINYQLQWDLEKKIRTAHRSADIERARELADIANSKGFGKFDIKTMQLGKDDRLLNLAVLCPNHHRYVHDEDLGFDIFKYIPKRI
jgi:hypothetical protein